MINCALLSRPNLVAWLIVDDVEAKFCDGTARNIRVHILPLRVIEFQ